MKFLKKYLVLSLIILFVSCNSSVKELLHGSWAISTFTYNNKDMSSQMVTNMISFTKEGKVRIPKIGFEGRDKSKQLGKWNFEENFSQIFLDTHSEYLIGYFDICFMKNFEKNTIRLVLKSDELYLEAEKFLSENHLLDILPISCEENDSLQTDEMDSK